MKLLSITIIRLVNGPDRVSIKTDLPAAAYPYTDKLELSFSVAKGNAVEYCAQNLPDVPIKEIL